MDITRLPAHLPTKLAICLVVRARKEEEEEEEEGEAIHRQAL
jgi:hypothetical protein